MREIKTQGLCGTCYARKRYAEDPGYRARERARHREFIRAKRRGDPEWVERVRAKDRERGARKRGEQVVGQPRRKTDGPCSICGQTPIMAKHLCGRCYRREWMRRKRREDPTVRQRETARNAERVAANSAAIQSAKRQPCADCGGEFPLECMDFDHIAERGRKVFNLSKAGARLLEAVLAEIAKCDLICANCHRIRSRARASAQGRNGMC